MLVDVLKEEGVNVRGVWFDLNVCIVFVFVIFCIDGEREFMFYWNLFVDMLMV